MDLRSSKVIGMAWNLRSACRNRWSASPEYAQGRFDAIAIPQQAPPERVGPPGAHRRPHAKAHPENRSSNVPRGIRNRLRSSFAFASRSSPRLITPVFTARDRIDGQTRGLSQTHHLPVFGEDCQLLWCRSARSTDQIPIECVSQRHNPPQARPPAAAGSDPIPGPDFPTHRACAA